MCAVSWLFSNLQAGLSFSHAGFWVANTLVQGVSFATVGLLIATLRVSLLRERGLSRTDPLTSLLNTRAFLEEGNRTLALCRRHRRPVTIAYLDLDNFKSVNDRLGHQAGDDLLRGVAKLIRVSIRLTDLAARLGGDEFAILLPEAGADQAGATLERLRSVLADTFAAIAVPVTVSVGAVSHLKAPDDLEQMVQRADACMYKAKSTGKNRLCLEVVGRDGVPERLREREQAGD